MSQREIVMKLWGCMTQLTRIQLDLVECGRQLHDWQLERLSKGLKADEFEMFDSLSLAWQSETLDIAQDAIKRIHDRLRDDLVINEV